MCFETCALIENSGRREIGRQTPKQKKIIYFEAPFKEIKLCDHFYDRLITLSDDFLITIYLVNGSF
jgi:hypothetical protein